MPAITEYAIQRAVCIWLRTPGVLIPQVVWWHTPNGGTRDVREAVRLKEAGVLAGIPDLFFLWGRLHGLELKKPGGVRSQAQKALHPLLEGAGAFVATVDSLQGARDQIVSWGLTVNVGGDSISK